MPYHSMPCGWPPKRRAACGRLTISLDTRRRTVPRPLSLTLDMISAMLNSSGSFSMMSSRIAWRRIPSSGGRLIIQLILVLTILTCAIISLLRVKSFNPTKAFTNKTFSLISNSHFLVQIDLVPSLVVVVRKRCTSKYI
jgi:hypothetical protein